MSHSPLIIGEKEVIGMENKDQMEPMEHMMWMTILFGLLCFSIFITITSHNTII